MDVFFLLLLFGMKALIFGMGVRALLTGRVWAKGWSGIEVWTGRILYRDESPIAFWITVVVYLCAPVIMAVAILMDR